MALYDEITKLQQDKYNLWAQEQQLREQRKYQIANLAEQYGILSLPDEEICSAFQLLANHNV